MFYRDDTMHRSKPKTFGKERRHLYKGNWNPSPMEFAREGYATLAMADPKAPPWGNSLKNRDTLADDAEFDPMLVEKW